MVPNIAGTGTSFKGAALYYLHDKRQEGEAERLTDDRVAWSQTRNLATDDRELAWKIMAATALDQDRLKAGAGVKATGRKSNAAVYAYSIAWHPEESGKLTREEMLQAAEASIKAIGGEDRQALIVAHNDEPHPHVHVILNRVSPADGRMLGTSNDRLKLSEWALAYRQARGEAEKYCPDRAKNVEARKKGEYVRASSDTPRSLEAYLAEAKGANDNSAAKERDRQKALSAALAERSAALAGQHRQQWKDLSATYRAKRTALLYQVREEKARVAAAIKEQFRPSWVELARRHGIENRAFRAREGSLGGKIENAIQAIARRREIDPEKSRGFMADAFNYILSRRAREDALGKLHAAEVRNLKAEQNREIRGAASGARTRADQQFATNRKSFVADRRALMARQGAERQQISEAWQVRREDSARAFDRLKRERGAKDALPRSRPTGTEGEPRSAFERASDLAAAVRRRSKNRNRDKDRDDRDR